MDDPSLGQPCKGCLAFTLPAGSYSARLYSPAEGRYTGEPRDLAGGETGIDLGPFSHDIVVHIEAVG